MRIGYGFDSHEFRPGVPLKIGGIAIPHDKGLGGHSDGDVLLQFRRLLFDNERKNIRENPCESVAKVLA